MKGFRVAYLTREIIEKERALYKSYLIVHLMSFLQTSSCRKTLLATYNYNMDGSWELVTLVEEGNIYVFWEI